jgi:hypothetical protein
MEKSKKKKQLERWKAGQVMVRKKVLVLERDDGSYDVYLGNEFYSRRYSRIEALQAADDLIKMSHTHGFIDTI